MYVVTLSVFHNLAIWLLYVNKPEPEPELENGVTQSYTYNGRPIESYY